MEGHDYVKPGDLVQINSKLSDLHQTHGLVLGKYMADQRYNTVLCHDSQVRYYLNDSLRKITTDR